MKRHRIVSLVAIGLVVLWGTWQLCAQGGNEPARRAPALAPVAAASALGRIEPASRIRKVAPPDFLSNPRLESLLVKEGDVVRQGDLLGWFAGRAKALAAQQSADAAVARTQAEVAKVKAGAKSGDLLAAEARERRATTIAERAGREAERARQLLARRIISSSEAEARIADHAAALQEAQAAARERDALAEIRAVDLAVAEAAVAEARAELARQQAEVAVQEIRAPIPGTVLRITVMPGEAADAKGVLELADLTALNVVADIYETDAAQLRTGQPAEVTVPGRTERFRGVVHELGWMVKKKEVLATDPVADIDGRVVEVRIRLEPAAAHALQRMSNQQVQVVIAPAAQLAAQ